MINSSIATKLQGKKLKIRELFFLSYGIIAANIIYFAIATAIYIFIILNVSYNILLFLPFIYIGTIIYLEKALYNKKKLNYISIIRAYMLSLILFTLINFLGIFFTIPAIILIRDLNYKDSVLVFKEIIRKNLKDSILFLILQNLVVGVLGAFFLIFLQKRGYVPQELTLKTIPPLVTLGIMYIMHTILAASIYVMYKNTEMNIIVKGDSGYDR